MEGLKDLMDKQELLHLLKQHAMNALLINSQNKFNISNALLPQLHVFQNIVLHGHTKCNGIKKILE
jgi:hypothetical protein